MNKCPKCEAEIKEHSKFCEECGTKVAQETGKLLATLLILRGGTQGKEFHLEMEVTNVGRWDPDGGAFPEIDLTNDDTEAKVSRKHARIILDEDRFLLEDVGSLNGTYINRGPRLIPGEPQEVKDGDEIIMGKTFFKFTVHS